ncbi:hypothetical protein B0A71_12835 [Flavobacterium tructae]|uniref:Uncharacterized protein n=1 Tax=Flavobacterium tructae TaxID=1114873 RepID=A0A1S1J5D7_9FLAO|nr:hypothetical protein BHE19_12040 [Flavobacterium tructae]OXB19550.1 hypothetical protein B0A71_12835 [Flavobacterium tructae]
MNVKGKLSFWEYNPDEAFNSRQIRVDIVNQIINKIAISGRFFFSHQGEIDKILLLNDKVYMTESYSKKTFCLQTKDGRSPQYFHMGGTMWALTKDFVDFIQTGKKSNHNNGYGGLYCTHWGYPVSEMEEIQELAISLGYL